MLETCNFGFQKKRNCTIRIAKTKALISFAVTALAASLHSHKTSILLKIWNGLVTAKLTCAFVFA